MKRNNGRLCGCGRTGCLETYCSATGVARTAREFLEARPSDESLLRNMQIDDITSKDVYDAAVAGDQLAKDIFNFTGEILGQALADFTAFSAPEAFVIFGGLAKSENPGIGAEGSRCGSARSKRPGLGSPHPAHPGCRCPRGTCCSRHAGLTHCTHAT